MQLYEESVGHTHQRHFLLRIDYIANFTTDSAAKLGRLVLNTRIPNGLFTVDFAATQLSSCAVNKT